MFFSHLLCDQISPTLALPIKRMATITTAKLPAVFGPATLNRTTRIHSTRTLGNGKRVQGEVQPRGEERDKIQRQKQKHGFVDDGSSSKHSRASHALVDERMSTEGTGFPFGLSNNLLGWILLGVFGLIWSF